MSYTPSLTEIELVTGEYLDLCAPDPQRISLYAVAHALGNTCRYGGNCTEYYSVAEHAVLVSEKLEQMGASLALQFAGLHHDDAEFVLCDVPRPMKPLLGQYDKLTVRMDLAIWRALACDNGHALWYTDLYTDPLLKMVDRWACLHEAKALMPSRGRNWDNIWWDDAKTPIPTTPADIIRCDPPKTATKRYQVRHYRLLERARTTRRTFVDELDLGAALCYT
jgi:hypothetical protein